MALAINAYNAVIIHTFVVHGTSAHANAATRGGFFSKGARVMIGGQPYSADDLENGVLRGNSPGAAALGSLLGVPWLSKGPFGPGDPRGAHVSVGGHGLEPGGEGGGWGENKRCTKGLHWG